MFFVILTHLFGDHRDATLDAPRPAKKNYLYIHLYKFIESGPIRIDQNVMLGDRLHKQTLQRVSASVFQVSARFGALIK